MTDDCVFCDIIAGKFGTKFLHNDSDIVAFGDIHPIAPTHILIVPRVHVSDLSAAAKSASPTDLFGRLMAVAAALGEPAMKDGGYRVVVNTGPQSGQTVFHLHLHVLAGRHFAWPPG